MKETSELISQSRAILESSTDNPVLNMILETLTNIQSNISAMNQNIEKRFEALNSTIWLVSSRVTKLETDTADLNRKVRECEASCSGISNLYDKAQNQVETNTQTIAHHQSRINFFEKYFNTAGLAPRNDALSQIGKRFEKLEKQLADVKVLVNNQPTDSTDPKTVAGQPISQPENVKSLRENIDDLNSKVLDLQCRSMKNNLVFTGLRHTQDELCERKLRLFIQEQLGIEHHIEFGNVHRFGRRGKNNSRPIVARFLYYSDLQLVLQNAHLLKGTPFGISEQFPAEIAYRRRQLYPKYKEAKQQRRNAVLVRDKLFIDGKEFVLPPAYSPPENNVWNSPQREQDQTAYKTPGRPMKRQRSGSSPEVDRFVAGAGPGFSNQD